MRCSPGLTCAPQQIHAPTAGHTPALPCTRCHGSRAFLSGHTAAALLSSTSTLALCQSCSCWPTVPYTFISPQDQPLHGNGAGNCQSCSSYTALGSPPRLGWPWDTQDRPFLRPWEGVEELVLPWLCLCSPLQLAAGTGQCQEHSHASTAWQAVSGCQ